MAISADSGHSTASYRYHGSITPRAHLLEKVGSRCKHTKRDTLFLVKQDEQQAGQAQQEGIEQQGDDVKGADGVAEGCAGGNGHQHLGTVGDDALKDAGEGVQQGGGALGADAVSCQHSAGNQVHPLNSSLVFLILPHAPQKSSPVLSLRPYQLSGGQRRITAQLPKCGRRCNYLLLQCLRFKKNLIQGFP